MKSKSLELLACPVCHARLDFHGDNRDPIESGRLICSSCQKIYFVEHSFTHFV
jgi:uncharacterized protein YbaR (Trm112 family)